MEAMVAFILAGLALAGSPGPATLSPAATGAAFGWRRCFAYMLGIDLGMLAVMALTATGSVGLGLGLPGLAPAVTALAGAYFLYLAYRIATAPPPAAARPGSAPPGFLAGLLLSLVNPKGYAAMVALFSGFALLPGRPWVATALKLGVLAVIIAGVNLLWLWTGAALARRAQVPRTGRIINLCFAAALLASVGLTMLL